MDGMGKEKEIYIMLHDFCYVPRSEYLPVKKELIELINVVQDEVRDYFTFSFTFIGSTHRKMITKDLKGNVGYDFDVNIHVNDDDEEYSPDDIRRIIIRAFNKHMSKYGYNRYEDSTRVITIKQTDWYNSRIIRSCDLAIVYDCKNGRQKYIHYNKNQRKYEWQYMKMSNSELEARADWIKHNGYWQEVKDIYIDKKNWNDDPDKKSRSLYAETINEVFCRRK